MQHVLWLKVRAIANIGVPASVLKRAKVRRQNRCLKVLDEKQVRHTISLLGLESAKTSEVPAKPITRAEENLQEVACMGVELYRKAAGKLIYLSLEFRYFKYAAKELARRMSKQVRLTWSVRRDFIQQARGTAVCLSARGIGLHHLLCTLKAIGRSARTPGRTHRAGL